MVLFILHFTFAMDSTWQTNQPGAEGRWELTGGQIEPLFNLLTPCPTHSSLPPSCWTTDAPLHHTQDPHSPSRLLPSPLLSSPLPSSLCSPSLICIWLLASLAVPAPQWRIVVSNKGLIKGLDQVCCAGQHLPLPPLGKQFYLVEAKTITGWRQGLTGTQPGKMRWILMWEIRPIYGQDKQTRWAKLMWKRETVREWEKAWVRGKKRGTHEQTNIQGAN